MTTPNLQANARPSRAAQNAAVLRGWIFSCPDVQKPVEDDLVQPAKELPAGGGALFAMRKVAVGLARHHGAYVSDQNPYEERRYDAEELVYVVRLLAPNPNPTSEERWVPATGSSRDPLENPISWCGKLEEKAGAYEVDMLWFAPGDGCTHEFMKSAWDWFWRRGVSAQEVAVLAAGQRLLLTYKDGADEETAPPVERACSIVALPLIVFQALVNPSGSLEMPVLTVPEIFGQGYDEPLDAPPSVDSITPLASPSCIREDSMFLQE